MNVDSEISTDDEDEIADEETLTDRIIALRDIIPPTTRSYIYNKVDTTASWIKSGLVFSGKGLWVLSTSALLLGVPWALAFAEEQQMVEMEKEMKMRESGQEVCSISNLNSIVLVLRTVTDSFAAPEPRRNRCSTECAT